MLPCYPNQQFQMRILWWRMGVYAALKRGSFVSQLFMTISLLGVSLPTFLIGILLILVFAVSWAGCQFRARRRGAARLLDAPGCSRRKGWLHIIAAGDHAWPFSS